MLKSIDVLIMLLHHVTMEILINMVAAILKEDTPLFITFDIAHMRKPTNLLPKTAWKYDKVGMSVKSRLRAHYKINFYCLIFIWNTKGTFEK